MSINPIEKNTTPDPTGNLEELFRHHLGEGAAVPPRLLLWDQIDNSLLVRQNEVYRRRLAATRWVAAASLLLATLAGTGWWARRDTSLGGTAAVATTDWRGPAGSSTPGALAGPPAGKLAGSTEVTSAYPQTAARPSPAATPADNPAAGQGRTASALPGEAARTGQASSVANGRNAGFGSAAIAQALKQAVAVAALETGRGNPAGAQAMPRRTGAAAAANAAMAGHFSGSARGNTAFDPRNASATERAGAAPATADGVGEPLLALSASGSPMPSAPLLGAAPETAGNEAVATGFDQLSTRLAAVTAPDMAGLPTGLAALPAPVTEEPATARRWVYSARYTAASFNPNINFSRVGIEAEHDYNRALGPDSPALTEEAAAQYRDHLRPGLSQRLAVLATRHLRGHWRLSTGVELSQATASSASTLAFLGEQLPDGQFGNQTLRTTAFRYRLASVPVEVRYANPLKRGWSLYGRLGGAVSALLGVRSEVAGNPEATKTYSLLSAGTPYRRAMASVHGGVGAQFASRTGKWAVSLGPVAEMGLVSLNAHPAQSFLGQRRPYSIGIEAGVEFGR